ncbi:putative vacuolar protein sorting-associated protein vps13 [Paratrimastix pyriformis]|uniref:Vacuolar protein sorting-associated protein vps13 n=1 Tax=Paratrimastix pyriformis TaxID=342808 RepID=A0ABQ8UCD0_9EUKA|nr:putative vacuolar protein sorting-associated protein vps13 [Paratrimastix pyriformis]
MFEKFALDVLSKYLGQYFENFEKEQLRVGLFKGTLEINNLRLKPDSLKDLHPGLLIKKGLVGRIAVSLTWTNLKAPISILLEDLALLVGPKPLTYGQQEIEEREVERQLHKQARLLALEQRKLTRDEGSQGQNEADEPSATRSFVERLIARFMENIQLTVRNVHLRYEDNACPEHPIVFGLTVAEVEARSTDERWRLAYNPDAPAMRKLVQVKMLSLYAGEAILESTDDADFRRQMMALVVGMDSSSSTHDFLMMPCNIKGRLTVIKDDAAVTLQQPKILADIHVDQFRFRVSNQHYRRLATEQETLARYGKYDFYQSIRPQGAPHRGEQAALFWRWAYTCVLRDLGTQRAPYTWAAISQRRDDRVRYVALYKFLLQEGEAGVRRRGRRGEPSATEAEIEELEWRYTLEDILYFRSLAEKQFRLEVAQRRADQGRAEAEWNQKGALSRMFTSKPRDKAGRRPTDIWRRADGFSGLNGEDNNGARQPLPPPASCPPVNTNQESLASLSEEERAELLKSLGADYSLPLSATLPQGAPLFTVSFSVGLASLSLWDEVSGGPSEGPAAGLMPGPTVMVQDRQAGIVDKLTQLLTFKSPSGAAGSRPQTRPYHHILLPAKPHLVSRLLVHAGTACQRTPLVDIEVGLVEGAVTHRPSIQATKIMPPRPPSPRRHIRTPPHPCTTTQVKLSVDTLEVMDRWTPGTKFPTLCTKRSPTRALVELEVDIQPLDGLSDAKIHCVMTPLLLTLSKPILHRLSTFMQQTSVSTLRRGARRGAAHFKRGLTGRLRTFLQRHPQIDMSIEVDAPTLLIPADPLSEASGLLVFELGRLSLTPVPEEASLPSPAVAASPAEAPTPAAAAPVAPVLVATAAPVVVAPAPSPTPAPAPVSSPAPAVSSPAPAPASSPAPSKVPQGSPGRSLPPPPPPPALLRRLESRKAMLATPKKDEKFILELKDTRVEVSTSLALWRAGQVTPLVRLATLQVNITHALSRQSAVPRLLITARLPHVDVHLSTLSLRPLNDVIRTVLTSVPTANSGAPGAVVKGSEDGVRKSGKPWWEPDLDVPAMDAEEEEERDPVWLSADDDFVPEQQIDMDAAFTLDQVHIHMVRSVPKATAPASAASTPTSPARPGPPSTPAGAKLFAAFSPLTGASSGAATAATAATAAAATEKVAAAAVPSETMQYEHIALLKIRLTSLCARYLQRPYDQGLTFRVRSLVVDDLLHPLATPATAPAEAQSPPMSPAPAPAPALAPPSPAPGSPVGFGSFAMPRFVVPTEFRKAAGGKAGQAYLHLASSLARDVPQMAEWAGDAASSVQASPLVLPRPAAFTGLAEAPKSVGGTPDDEDEAAADADLVACNLEYISPSSGQGLDKVKENWGGDQRGMEYAVISAGCVSALWESPTFAARGRTQLSISAASHRLVVRLTRETLWALAQFSPTLRRAPRLLRDMGQTRLRLSAELGSVIVLLERGETPIASALLARTRVTIVNTRTTTQVEASLGQFDLYDRTPLGRLYPHVVGFERTKPDVHALTFQLFRFHRRAADYPGHDIFCHFHAASLRAVFLQRFVTELRSFSTRSAAILGGIVSNATTKLSHSIVAWLSQPGAHVRPLVKLDLHLDRPLLLVPLHSRSGRVIVANLGSLTLTNEHLKAPPDTLRLEAPLSISALPAAALAAQQSHQPYLNAPLPPPPPQVQLHHTVAPWRDPTPPAPEGTVVVPQFEEAPARAAHDEPTFTAPAQASRVYEVTTFVCASLNLFTAALPSVEAGSACRVNLLRAPPCGCVKVQGSESPVPAPLAEGFFARVVEIVQTFDLHAVACRTTNVATHPAELPVVKAEAFSHGLTVSLDEDQLGLAEGVLVGNLLEDSLLDADRAQAAAKAPAPLFMGTVNAMGPVTWERGLAHCVRRRVVDVLVYVPQIQCILLQGNQLQGTARPLTTLELSTIHAGMTHYSDDETLAHCAVQSLLLADTRLESSTVFKQIISSGSGSAQQKFLSLIYHREPSTTSYLQVVLSSPRVFAFTEFIFALKDYLLTHIDAVIRAQDRHLERRMQKGINAQEVLYLKALATSRRSPLFLNLFFYRAEFSFIVDQASLQTDALVTIFDANLTSYRGPPAGADRDYYESQHAIAMLRAAALFPEWVRRVVPLMCGMKGMPLQGNAHGLGNSFSGWMRALMVG